MKKIKNLYEKIIYAKFSVVSEYMFIIFIAQVFTILSSINWESKNE
jgi:hypothetical protein